MISFFKKTFASETFKRLFKNTGVLISGDTVSAILSVLTLAITARALGTEKLGMLVLIDAYVRLVDKLINFQSWQFMIKYFSDALSTKDTSGFKALVKLGTIVDAFTALIGCVTSVALVTLIAHWQKWSPEMIFLARIYSLIVLCDIAGVPTGILRIFGKFKSFSVQKSITSVIKFAGVLVAWVLRCDLSGFLWVWMLTEIIDYLSLTAMAWTELHRRDFRNIWTESLAGITKRFPGVWKFLISTNLTGSVKVGFQGFDILVVGKLLGFSDVSLYNLAKKLCSALDRLANPLFQSLYPELTKLWANKDFKDFRFVVKRMIYLLGGLSITALIIFMIWGRGIIAMMAGREFIAAYSVTIWYLIANGIAVTALPLSPMILAMGQAHLSFWIQFLPTLIYFPVLFWLVSTFGLNGAGYAYIVYHGIRVALQCGFAKQLLKKTPRDALPPSPVIATPEEVGV